MRGRIVSWSRRTGAGWLGVLVPDVAFRAICQCRLGPFVCLLLSSVVVLADTNAPDADELPPLRPPRPEIPLSFWQQHETSLVMGGVLLIVLVGACVWWLIRPKPPVIAPPAVTARQALDILRNQPETGLVLMKVSQVLRSYFAAVYQLPRGEFTTTEFACLMLNKGTVDSQLAAAVSDFLKQCDQRKFAPTAGQQLPLGAVARAAKLIDQAEAARAALAPQHVNA